MCLLFGGGVEEKGRVWWREKKGQGLLLKTDRMSLIVLVCDMQVASRQPARVGANSTGPIVVIGATVSVLRTIFLGDNENC